MQRFEMLKKHNRAEFENALKEGKADERMVKLCGFINSLPCFFTTSSCSGRILLLKVDANESKREAAFHRRWHRPVKAQELWDALLEQTDAEEIWLKQEPFILHVGTNALENAEKLLAIMQKSGIKRHGIVLAKPQKFIVEFQGNEAIAFPVKRKNEILIERRYLEYIAQRANEKLKRNYSRLKNVGKELRAGLK